jgi:dCMP deaminase
MAIMMRLSWNEYFMAAARLSARQSTCIRRQVGAVIVREKRIIATGYNGAPSGLPHCQETGCLRESLMVPSGERHELCRAVHAEQNAIIQAAKFGQSVDGAFLYVTVSPCIICAKMIINSGIDVIFYGGEYNNYDGSLDILREAKIELVEMGE